MRIKWSDFQPLTHNNTDLVPTQAGVYLLWCKLAKADWRLFYVGEASSLRVTLRRHLTAREPDRQLRRKMANCVTGFEYSVHPDPEVRAGILRFLIDYCKPELHVALSDPDAEPIEVNLP
jgi:excinuclease UvrABC nuclease subunit